MGDDRLQLLVERASDELTRRILPFWTHTVDKERGGFYGEISDSLEVIRDAQRAPF